jgi:integrase family protein with SAM-like domain
LGALYKRAGSRNWMMAVTVAGRQHCQSTHTTNKRRALQLLARWETEVFEGRFQLIKTNAPTFEEWADQFLPTIPHLKTRSRYASSVNNLKRRLEKLRLSRITSELIEDFKEKRLADGAGPATVNRGLAVLRRMLKLAERKRFIARSPFNEVELFRHYGRGQRGHRSVFGSASDGAFARKASSRSLGIYGTDLPLDKPRRSDAYEAHARSEGGGGLRPASGGHRQRTVHSS